MQRVPVVLVSPHPDDICLSMGGVMPYLLAHGHALTIFGDSRWADPSWGGPRDRAAIAQARAAEDAAYFHRFDFTYHQLRLPDSSLRQSRWSRLLSPGSSRAVLQAHARRGIETLVAHAAARLVIGPLGLGAHPDHIICRRALFAATRETTPLVMYEDLPYVSAIPLVRIEAEVSAMGRQLRPVLCETALTLARKFTDVAAAYPSQNDPAMLEQAASHSVRLARHYGLAEPAEPMAYERLWTTLAPDEFASHFGPGVRFI